MPLMPEQDNWYTKDLRINRGHPGLPENASEVPYLFSQPSNEAANNLKFNSNWKPLSENIQPISNESNKLKFTEKGTTGKPWTKDPLNIHGNKYNLKLSELKDQEGIGAFSRVKGKTTIDNKTIWDKDKFDQLSNSLDLFMKGISMAGGKGLLTRR